MARPLEFDREQALLAAMQLFWRQGYTATSMSQLLDTMGIGRSSFYAAFGDKRSLFIEAVDLFTERTLRILVEARQQLGPLPAIREFFTQTLFKVPARRARRGCLMVNSILELADVDDELSRHARRNLTRIEAEFESCLAEAMARGELNSHQTPAQLAQYLMMVNQGLRVASRKQTPKQEMLAMVDTALSVIGQAAA